MVKRKEFHRDNVGGEFPEGVKDFDETGRVEVRGFLLPPVLMHGTTAETARRRLKADGGYSCSGLGVMDAISGDTRAWPQNMHGVDVKKATVVFSTALAFLPEKGGDDSGLQIIRAPREGDAFSSAHIRFKRPPPGSFGIVYEDEDVSFERGTRPLKSGYGEKIDELRGRLIRKARER